MRGVALSALGRRHCTQKARRDAQRLMTEMMNHSSETALERENNRDRGHLGAVEEERKVTVGLLKNLTKLEKRMDESNQGGMGLELDYTDVYAGKALARELTAEDIGKVVVLDPHWKKLFPENISGTFGMDFELSDKWNWIVREQVMMAMDFLKEKRNGKIVVKPKWWLEGVGVGIVMNFIALFAKQERYLTVFVPEGKRIARNTHYLKFNERDQSMFDQPVLGAELIRNLTHVPHDVLAKVILKRDYNLEVHSYDKETLLGFRSANTYAPADMEWYEPGYYTAPGGHTLTKPSGKVYNEEAEEDVLTYEPVDEEKIRAEVLKEIDNPLEMPTRESAAKEPEDYELKFRSGPTDEELEKSNQWKMPKVIGTIQRDLKVFADLDKVTDEVLDRLHTNLVDNHSYLKQFRRYSSLGDRLVELIEAGDVMNKENHDEVYALTKELNTMSTNMLNSAGYAESFKMLEKANVDNLMTEIQFDEALKDKFGLHLYGNEPCDVKLPVSQATLLDLVMFAHSAPENQVCSILDDIYKEIALATEVKTMVILDDANTWDGRSMHRHPDTLRPLPSSRLSLVKSLAHFRENPIANGVTVLGLNANGDKEFKPWMKAPQPDSEDQTPLKNLLVEKYSHIEFETILSHFLMIRIISANLAGTNPTWKHELLALSDRVPKLVPKAAKLY